MKYLALSFLYFPIVLQGIVAAEQALAGAPGATKKEAVLSAIQAAAAVGEKTPEEHVAVISSVIDTVVGSLNKTGWFASKPKA